MEAGTKRTRVFAGPQRFESSVGLGPGHLSAFHRGDQLGGGVPDPDLPDHGVELAGISGGPETCRLFLGDSPRRHHSVEALDETEPPCFLLFFAHVFTLSIRYVSIKSHCLRQGVVYPRWVPKLWSETIESHRKEVREAILETTATMVAEGGLRSVAMAKVAETVGIGRATLYKYFPDIDSILMAWHEEHVAHHLDQLAELRDGTGTPLERLRTVLGAYGTIIYQVAREHHGSDLATLVHQGGHVDQAERDLGHLVKGLLDEGVQAGEIRDDVPSRELAQYCIKALGGATSLVSDAAVRRLVAVTIDGLRPGR
jgi:AcrR family transcriptional regulator